MTLLVCVVLAVGTIPGLTWAVKSIACEWKSEDSYIIKHGYFHKDKNNVQVCCHNTTCGAGNKDSFLFEFKLNLLFYCKTVFALLVAGTEAVICRTEENPKDTATCRKCGYGFYQPTIVASYDHLHNQCKPWSPCNLKGIYGTNNTNNSLFEFDESISRINRAT